MIAVLHYLVWAFKTGVHHSEREANEILERYDEDTALACDGSCWKIGSLPARAVEVPTGGSTGRKQINKIEVGLLSFPGA